MYLLLIGQYTVLTQIPSGQYILIYNLQLQYVKCMYHRSSTSVALRPDGPAYTLRCTHCGIRPHLRARVRRSTYIFALQPFASSLLEQPPIVHIAR